MPTYQYECANCGHELEALQSMIDKKLKKCPECGKSTLERLIGSGTGIIFKGSGFYETDYKKRDSRHSAESSGRDSNATNSVGTPVSKTLDHRSRPKGVSESPKTEPAKKPSGGCHNGPCACA